MINCDRHQSCPIYENAPATGRVSIFSRKCIRDYSEVALLAFLLLISVLGVSGQSTDAVTQLNPGVSVGIEINKKVRLDLSSGREKSDELNSAKWKLTVGASFRMKPLFTPFKDDADSDKQHIFVIGTAYEYSRASQNGEESIEHRLMLDGTGRYNFPGKLLLSDRNRVEFRWVNSSYRFRYRNRLMLERPLRLRKFTVTPFASAEAYWDQHYSQWNKYEFSGGVEIPLIRRSSLNLYYTRERCLTCSDLNTNIFGIEFKVFFRRKK